MRYEIEYNVARIERERVRNGLTQAELAAKAGLSTKTISNVLRDRRMTVVTARKLAAALDIPIACFVPEPDTESVPA